MISNAILNIASGSAQATPNVGSAAIDYVTDLPSMLIGFVGGFFKQIGF